MQCGIYRQKGKFMRRVTATMHTTLKYKITIRMRFIKKKLHKRYAKFPSWCVKEELLSFFRSISFGKISLDPIKFKQFFVQ
jgi:hypothetical protein